SVTYLVYALIMRLSKSWRRIDGHRTNPTLLRNAPQHEIIRTGYAASRIPPKIGTDLFFEPQLWFYAKLICETAPILNSSRTRLQSFLKVALPIAALSFELPTPIQVRRYTWNI